jgi:hypothetical protein
MKVLVSALLLMLVSAGAQADWKKIAETDAARYYFNPDNLQKDGDYRKVWEIHDYKKRDADGELSLRLHMEYDCKASKYRLLGFSTHSEAMAEGTTLVSNGNVGEWMEIPANTLVARNLKLFCER